MKLPFEFDGLSLSPTVPNLPCATEPIRRTSKDSRSMKVNGDREARGQLGARRRRLHLDGPCRRACA